MVIVAVSLFVGCKNEPEAKTYKVGDTIKLGSKGNTPIEWLVLEIDTEDNTALVISKDILEARAFGTDNSYKKSSIKEYLNQPETVETFFKNYGLKTDYMVKVDVTTAIETTTKKDTGEDYVFLLSKTEAAKYFKDDAARIAKYGEDAAIWFLRSPYDNIDNHSVSGVGTDGKISTCIVSQKLGIRPAFWCKLSEINN